MINALDANKCTNGKQMLMPLFYCPETERATSIHPSSSTTTGLNESFRLICRGSVGHAAISIDLPSEWLQRMREMKGMTRAVKDDLEQRVEVI